MKRAVLVNGVPASGKSTVARTISVRFGWPLMALDTVKEPFMQELAPVDRAFNRRLGRAAYAAIFDSISGFPDGTTVVDAWFGFQPAGVLAAHLARAGIAHAVEVWCRASPETVVARYAARIPARTAGHPGAEYLPELQALAAAAQPLGAYPLVTVVTDVALDADALCASVSHALETCGAPLTR